MTLAILHREPGTEPLPGGSAVWRTCLREVEFLNGHAPENPEGQHLEDAAAYGLLLEILCGLQSPMLGETQVLGQFKTFVASLGPDGAWLSRVGQRLIGDARDVRTTHLQGLGSRSYGSAVRRDLEGFEHAVLIGAGKLAGEVLPFLLDGGRPVDQWGRAAVPDGALAAGVTYHTIDSARGTVMSTRDTALVVAAPVSTEIVERVAAGYPSLRRVIDLRADVGDRRPALEASVVSLQDLFARMLAAHASAMPAVDAARADIATRARQYSLRDELRPFGWDDLCA